MNFVAIDFETANQYRNSACSVAVVEVKNGEIYDSYYALIRPPIMQFNRINIDIHGITPADVRDKPNFSTIWSDLKPCLEGRNVIAHNASFDMSVLKSCLTYYKLGTLGDYFHIDFQHHNALDDARTCACVALLAAKKLQVTSFRELITKLGLPNKKFC